MLRNRHHEEHRSVVIQWLLFRKWLFTQKDYFSGGPHQLTLVRQDGNYRFLFVEIPNWGLILKKT